MAKSHLVLDGNRSLDDIEALRHCLDLGFAPLGGLLRIPLPFPPCLLVLVLLVLLPGRRFSLFAG